MCFLQQPGRASSSQQGDDRADFRRGGTGVLGRPLVEALVDRGHEVTASTHRTENLSVIEALGARPALMDGLDDAAVRQAILETEPEVISTRSRRSPRRLVTTRGGWQ